MCKAVGTTGKPQLPSEISLNVQLWTFPGIELNKSIPGPMPLSPVCVVCQELQEGNLPVSRVAPGRDASFGHKFPPVRKC